jgi:hypothetical protein
MGRILEIMITMGQILGIMMGRILEIMITIGQILGPNLEIIIIIGYI